MKAETIWDVIVVGGGPAGMMSAGVSAKKGARVLLIEKNDTLGKKLLITGGGRCNVTNSEFDSRKFLTKFKTDSKFLFSAFAQYGVKETLDFFHSNNMPTKVENELRTFPVSDSAKSVWQVLVNVMKKYQVTIWSNTEVVDLVRESKQIIGVKLKNQKIIHGKSIIIATGGKSHPETGSTGDGFIWLKNIGHTVVDSNPALVPLKIKESWLKKLAGTTINNLKITVWQNNTKQKSTDGKILFTHVGLSGPTILNMSKDIGELLKYGEVNLTLDLLPYLDHSQLNTTLQDLFKEHTNKKIKNTLAKFIPKAISPIILELAKIDPETYCNKISRENRLKLIELLKNIPLTVTGLLGTKKAIITSGGVDLKEIDFKTMRSRLFSNLYIIGDMLNIDRPSGGYSLQLCWTTGYVAGNAIEF